MNPLLKNPAEVLASLVEGDAAKPDHFYIAFMARDEDGPLDSQTIWDYYFQPGIEAMARLLDETYPDGNIVYHQLPNDVEFPAKSITYDPIPMRLTWEYKLDYPPYEGADPCDGHVCIVELLVSSSTGKQK